MIANSIHCPRQQLITLAYANSLVFLLRIAIVLLLIIGKVTYEEIVDNSLASLRLLLVVLVSSFGSNLVECVLIFFEFDVVLHNINVG